MRVPLMPAAQVREHEGDHALELPLEGVRALELRRQRRLERRRQEHAAPAPARTGRY
jgi:hypothetical protein